MSWESNTCQSCTYQKDKVCRLNPPVASRGSGWFSNYPSVHFHDSIGMYEEQNRPLKHYYLPACSKYEGAN